MSKCNVCQHKTEKKLIVYTQWYHGNLVAVENVKADVCPNCGEEYYSPKVADEIHKTIEFQHPSKTLKVPVFQLA